MRTTGWARYEPHAGRSAGPPTAPARRSSGRSRRSAPARWPGACRPGRMRLDRGPELGLGAVATDIVAALFGRALDEDGSPRRDGLVDAGDQPRPRSAIRPPDPGRSPRDSTRGRWFGCGPAGICRRGARPAGAAWRGRSIDRVRAGRLPSSRMRRQLDERIFRASAVDGDLVAVLELLDESMIRC